MGGRTPPAHVDGRTPAHVGGRTPPAPGVPVDFLPIFTRNGSGTDEIEHKSYHPARNFDASPALTMGMQQDH